jgi:undecaprenyl-diphosphatase
LGVIAFSTFGNLALVVIREETLVQFDSQLATALYANSSGSEIIFFSTITSLGGLLATTVLGGGIAIALFIYRQRLLFISWIVATLGNSLLNGLLKTIFQRGRPEFDEPILIETYYSFPSGHAMGAVVLYGMIAYLLIVLFHHRTNPIYLISLVVTLVILIGFSRLYLGAHYFSDVLAGYLAGIGWLSIVISGTEIARRRQLSKTLAQPTVAQLELHPN